MPDNNSAGQVITKETADRDFGKASFSQMISSDQLKEMAAKTTKLLMFSFINQKLYILADERKPLFPEGATVPEDRVFRVYSKDKVLELIKSGGRNDNSIELRGDLLTVTNGNYTLEFGSFCPPWCS
jgi:hypothetical protein